MSVPRVLGIALFIALALSALVGLHFYLATRLILETGLPPGVERGLLLLVAALGATLVLQPISERLLGPPLSRLLSWPASIWMGLVFLLVVGLSASDALLWLLGRPALAAPGDAADALVAARVRALGVASLAGLAGAAGVVSALRGPLEKRVEVGLPRWPRELDGFRIVQISDIHIGPILGRAFAEELVVRCNALAPDLIAVTGDLVDGGVVQLADEVAPFARLRAHHGVYFVTGNHDHYSGARAWVRAISELGIRVLRNERVAIGGGPAGFDLAGTDDYYGSFEPGQREDLGAALEGRDPDRPLVLLAHDPRTFKRAARAGVDLQLSGHTHGGQIWPFRYLVRLVTRWVSGLHRDGGSQLYVSRGTGFWGPAMRLFEPAEITELVIRREESS